MTKTHRQMIEIMMLDDSRVAVVRDGYVCTPWLRGRSGATWHRLLRFDGELAVAAEVATAELARELEGAWQARGHEVAA